MSRPSILILAIILISFTKVSGSCDLYNTGKFRDVSRISMIDSIIHRTPEKDVCSKYYAIELMDDFDENIMRRKVPQFYNLRKDSINYHITLSTCDNPIKNFVFVQYGGKSFFIDIKLKDYFSISVSKNKRKFRYTTKPMIYSQNSHWYLAGTKRDVLLLYYRYKKLCIRWDWKRVLMESGDCDPIDFTNIEEGS